MSSHMSEFRTGEEILEHMLEQKSRGADILKLVTTCNTEEELNAEVAAYINDPSDVVNAIKHVLGYHFHHTEVVHREI